MEAKLAKRRAVGKYKYKYNTNKIKIVFASVVAGQRASLTGGGSLLNTNTTLTKLK